MGGTFYHAWKNRSPTTKAPKMVNALWPSPNREEALEVWPASDPVVELAELVPFVAEFMAFIAA